MFPANDLKYSIIERIVFSFIQSSKGKINVKYGTKAGRKSFIHFKLFGRWNK